MIKTIPLGKLTKINTNEYLLQTDFVDGYNDCIDIILIAKKDFIYVSDDGTFNAFYFLDDKQKERINYIRKELNIQIDKENGIFYKKTNKNKETIYNTIISFVQFLIQINTIAISFLI